MHRRRTVAIIAVTLAAAVVACGGDDADTGATSAAPTTQPVSPAGSTDTAPADSASTVAPSAATAATRTVQSMHGPVDVPVDPQRVVALDEYAALNALALGIRPTLVFTTYQSEVGGEVLRDAGVELQPGTAEAGPNLEALAAADPDLILLTYEGAIGVDIDQMAAIAPPVSLPYTAPWRDVIHATADVFGRQNEADRLIEVLDERIQALHAELATDPPSLSILADSLGMLFAVSMTSPLSQVAAEAGFTRPQAQLDGVPDTTFESAIPISTETLAEHDADIIAVLSGAYYNADTLLDAPTFQALPAVVDGRSVVVDGDMWFGTYPFAIWWLLDDLEALHAGEGQDGIGGADDIGDRWAAFEAAS